MFDVLRNFLSQPAVLSLWLSLNFVSVVWLLYDLLRHNNKLAPLMKFVWVLTILYSGFLGLAIYYYAGRAQIKRDTIWRQACRSVSHCYSGCGAGEISGVFIAVGLLNLHTTWVVIITFTLAYVFGVGLTFGPLVQEGMNTFQAFKDAIYSETASIVVMEAVAITIDLFLAQDATITEPLFWSSLLISLSLGLVAAYPVNIVLLKLGVKKGMHNPREQHSS